MVNESEADWFHLDVMDGRFVPNITFGMFVVEAMKKMAQKPLDVHLMIVEPERYVEGFRKAGADVISVHYEACPHLHRVVQQIRAAGAKAGVALNPHTPVSGLENLLEDIDLVCMMSVNPGFGGQSFIPRSIAKVAAVRALLDRCGNVGAAIEIDGGIDAHNAARVVAAGARILVAGNAVFGTPDPEQATRELKAIAELALAGSIAP